MRDTTDANENKYDPDGVLLRQTTWTSQINAVYLTLNSIATPTGTMKDINVKLRYLDGTTKDLSYADLKFRDVYKDDYTGQPMNHQLTKEAIVNEIAYFADKVWRLTTKEHAMSLPNSKLIGGMWVMTNKGDEESP